MRDVVRVKESSYILGFPTLPNKKREKNLRVGICGSEYAEEIIYFNGEKWNIEQEG